MAGVNRLAGGLRRPLLPDLERAAGFIGNADAAPQRQQRAGDRLAGGAVGLVIGEIGVAAGAVILAMCVDAQRIGKGRAVMIERARIEGGQVLRLGPARHLPFQIFDRRFRDQHFRQRLRLRQERPVPHLHGHVAIHAVPHVVGRHDVERRHALDAARMIEREAIGDAAAAVVAGQPEAHMAELLHHLDHDLRHRALVVRRVILVGAAAPPTSRSRQVGDDQREALRERGRHACHITLVCV